MTSRSQDAFHPLLMVWADEAIISHTYPVYTFTIKKVDHKALYCAARPKRIQEYMNIESFMSIWINHEKAFEKDPPEIAFVYNDMPIGTDNIAYAIPIKLSNPIKEAEESYRFSLSFPEKAVNPGTYSKITLFIDWFPNPICPEPIVLLFPESIPR